MQVLNRQTNYNITLATVVSILPILLPSITIVFLSTLHCFKMNSRIDPAAGKYNPVLNFRTKTLVIGVSTIIFGRAEPYRTNAKFVTIPIIIPSSKLKNKVNKIVTISGMRSNSEKQIK